MNNPLVRPAAIVIFVDLVLEIPLGDSQVLVVQDILEFLAFIKAQPASTGDGVFVENEVVVYVAETGRTFVLGRETLFERSDFIEVVII